MLATIFGTVAFSFQYVNNLLSKCSVIQCRPFWSRLFWESPGLFGSGPFRPSTVVMVDKYKHIQVLYIQIVVFCMFIIVN